MSGCPHGLGGKKAERGVHEWVWHELRPRRPAPPDFRLQGLHETRHPVGRNLAQAPLGLRCGAAAALLERLSAGAPDLPWPGEARSDLALPGLMIRPKRVRSGLTRRDFDWPTLTWPEDPAWP